MRKGMSYLLIMAMTLSLGVTGCNKVSTQKEPTTEASTEEVVDATKEPDFDQLTGVELDALSNNYSVYVDIDEVVDFNGFGYIVKPTDTRYERISDLLSGETLYYSASYIDFVKNDNGDYDRRVYSRLYDKEGNILIDWKNTVYSQALGDWIVTRDYFDVNMDFENTDFKAKLYNLKTEESIDDVWSLNKLDDKHIEADSFGKGMLGILDENGKKLSGFPWSMEDGSDETLYAGSYLFTYKEDAENFTYDLNVYDPDLRLVGTLTKTNDNSFYNDNIVGPYLRQDGKVYDMSKADGDELKPVLDVAEVSYMDQEVAIIQQEMDGPYVLYNWKDKKAVSAEYDKIVSEIEDKITDEVKEAEIFVGIKDGKLEKLDRSGKVLATGNLDGAGYVICLKDAFVGITDDWNHAALFDADMKEIIPAGTYKDITAVYEDEKHPENSLYSCTYDLNPNGDEARERVDLVKGDGSVLLKNCSTVGSQIEGRFAVVRGQNAGLMDTSGRWISKVKKYELNNMD